MPNNIFEKISFYGLSAILVLLPVFVLPGALVPLASHKGFLLVAGLIVSILAFIVARLKDGKLILPKSWILLSGALVVVSTLLSALFSSAREMSMFGVAFDTGSFWFICSAFLLMLFSALVINNEIRARFVLLGALFASGIAFLFQILHFIAPGFFAFSPVTAEITSNLIGSWTGFGVWAGLVAILSVFLIEFFQVSKTLKRLLAGLLILSLFSIAAVNFLLIWKMVGVFALILFVYKISVFSSEEEEDKKNFPFFSFGLVLVSLLFLISSGFIGGSLSEALGTQRVEVRPNLPSTLEVAKGIVSESPVLGIGPNRWADAWSMYKSDSINATRFWDVPFSVGSGSLLTYASLGGALTFVSWLLLVFFTIATDFKIVSRGSRRKLNFTGLAFFIGGLYSLVVLAVYSGGLIMLLAMFGFLGVFVGLSREEDGEFLRFPSFLRKGFLSTLIMVILMLALVSLGVKYIEKFTATYRWNKALTSETIEQSESNIIRSLNLNTNDLYLRTYVQVYFAKINTLLNAEEPISEEDQLAIQNGFTQSVSALNQAIVWNPDSYINHQALANLYATAGNSNSDSDNFYLEAINEYQRASELNPMNPRLKLEIARIHFLLDDLNQAKDVIDESLALKGDYLDAIFIASQIQQALGNRTEAIALAEIALSLAPNEQILVDYLDRLRQGRAPAPDLIEESIEESTEEVQDSNQEEEEN